MFEASLELSRKGTVWSVESWLRILPCFITEGRLLKAGELGSSKLCNHHKGDHSSRQFLAVSRCYVKDINEDRRQVVLPPLYR